eukprot:6132594-Amphidinium_carterae.1
MREQSSKAGRTIIAKCRALNMKLTGSSQPLVQENFTAGLCEPSFQRKPTSRLCACMKKQLKFCHEGWR